MKIYLGNAKLAGFNKDLKLKGYDYNAVLSIFFVAYILFEIPSNVRHTGQEFCSPEYKFLLKDLY